MLRENCREGMKIVFGRTNGEKTIAVVVRTNPAKALVTTLENRGIKQAGLEWRVPYSMMEPVQEKTEGDLDELKSLLREIRIKHGVDYSILHKYGQTRVMCAKVWVESIKEVAAKLNIAINEWFTFE